jgi:gliding-associated putative ABC transporter substrate-binding component GldG
MQSAKRIDRALLLTALLGSLVVLNIIGLGFFYRYDLTQDHQFTLSSATHKVLGQLREPLTIRAYFTKDLPPPHASQARYVKDLLEEYYTAGKGKVRFEFIDPVGEESSEDKEKKKDVKQDLFGRQVRPPTTMEIELQQLGIPPVQVRVNQDDKLEVKRAYMGIAVKFADRHESIPVVQDTAGLEYDLTTLIRKVVHEQSTKLGLITGHGEPSVDDEFSRAHNALSEMFEVVELNLAAEPVPQGVGAVLAVGPNKAFTEVEKERLDAFISSGHAAGFLVGPVKPNLSTLEHEDNAGDLRPMLASYGLQVGDAMVLDVECATIQVAQQQGYMRVNQPMRYPFMPLPKSLGEHPLVRGLGSVPLPFMAPVSLSETVPASAKVEILVESSAKSWTQSSPYNLDPTQHWSGPQDLGELHAYGLLGTVKGELKPYYAANANAKTEASAQASADASAEKSAESAESAEPTEARVFVAGGDAFVRDAFFSKPSETLLLNLTDWLLRDDALLAVRSRGMAAAPLQELSDGSRGVVKYGNVLGLPFSFIGFGLLRWRRREKRRQQDFFA